MVDRARRMRRSVVGVLTLPEMQQKVGDQGIDVTPSSPEQFPAYVKTEMLKSAKVVKDAGLTGD